MAEREKTKMEHDEDEYNFNLEKDRMREGPVLRLRSSTAISPASPSPSSSNSRQNHTPAVVVGVSAMDLNASGSGRVTRNASQLHQEERANGKSASTSSQETENRKEEPFCQIFSSEKAFLEMQEVIKQVRGVLIMNPETIRKLLIQFNWDHDRLVEAYFDGREKMFQDTNIPPLAVSSGLYDSLDKTTRECPICFDEIPGERMASMYCSHTYCTDCWQRYIEANIELCLDQDIVCPHPRCPIILEEPGIRRSLGGSRKMKRYYRLRAQSFVVCHPKYRWCCPVVTEENCCNRAVRIDVPKWDKIECSCGRISCSDCSEDWHYPIKCNLLTTWRNKCIITLKNHPGWILNPISLCRFCKAPNEKSVGNYVKCQKRNCNKKYWIFWDHPTNGDTGHENEWEPEDYACYRPKTGTPTFQHIMRKKFYFYRFIQHEDSLRREKDFKFKASKMADEMFKSGKWNSNQANIIRKAVQVVAEIRLIVMYSYVFASYAIKTDDLDVFVEYQGLLEEAVEKLSYTISRFLRRPVMELNSKWLEGLVVEGEWIEENRIHLIDLVNKGYRNRTWKLNKE